MEIFCKPPLTYQHEEACYFYLAATYAQLGDLENALLAYSPFKKLNFNDKTISTLILMNFPFKNVEMQKTLVDGMIKILPE